MKEELEYELYLEKHKKKLTRLERDKNFLELEKKRLIQELELEKAKNSFLVKRENTLQLLETFLVERTKILKKLSNKEFEFAVVELEKLSDALEYERNKIFNEVEEDEREDDTRTCNEVERDSKRIGYITNRIQ